MVVSGADSQQNSWVVYFTGLFARINLIFLTLENV
jgi:hypothetical protein